MRKNKTENIGFISLKQASKISGYHPDYLSYLIRKGKIEGKKIGRDWFTTEEAVKNYLLSKKFFPLRDILFSKIKPSIIVVFMIAIALVGVVAFLTFYSENYFQESKGDFAEQKLQTKDFNIQTSSKYKLREIKVTTYSSDSAGGIEISVKPESQIFQPEKKSWWEKIKEQINNIFSRK